MNGLPSNVRQVASNKREKTFAELWRALNRAYEKNERSLERAYSNVQRVNAAYNDDLGSETVQKVIFTNLHIDRASKLDAVLEAAVRSKVFYAVFTLVSRFSAADRDNAWIDESIYFRRITDDSLKRTLYGSSSSTASISIRPDGEASVNGWTTFESFDDRYGRTNEIVSDRLLESARENDHDDDSESDDESMGISIAVDMNICTAPPVGAEFGTLTLVLVVSTCFFLYFCLAGDEPVDGDHVGFNERQLHSNYKNKSVQFVRPTAASPWTLEIYKNYFNSFYQETRGVMTSENFRFPLIPHEHY